MEEETRRYYGQMIGSLQGYYPEQKTYTRDQIDELASSQWGTTVTDISSERKSALEALQVTTPDPVDRAQVETKFSNYYDQKRDGFERHFFAAVDEIYKQNGITKEEPSLDNRDPQNQQTVEVRTNPRQEIDRADSAATQSWTGERAVFRTDRDTTDDIIRNGRDTMSRQGRATPEVAAERDLDRKAQQIAAVPPQQSAHMTKDQFAVALAGGRPDGGGGQGQTDPTQPGNGPGGEKGQPNQAILQNTPSAQARAELGITGTAQTTINSPFFREPTISEAQYRAQEAQRKHGQERDVEQRQAQNYGPSLSL